MRSEVDRSSRRRERRMVEGRKSLLENIFHACECGVCFTYRPERVILLCGHQICKDCVSSMWTTRKEQAKTQPPEQSKDKDWLNCPYCKANFKWTGSARGQRKSSRIDLNSAKFLGALQHYLDRKDLCQYRKVFVFTIQSILACYKLPTRYGQIVDVALLH